MTGIRDYLAERDAAATQGLERGRAVAAIRRVSSHELRQRAKVSATRLLTPRSKRQIKQLLASGAPLRLHLGSGGHPLEGWVNIDVIGMQPDLYWDLRRGIPFPDGSADAVFLEHVIEHFPLADVLDMLEECRRVLAPGGIVRLVVPDFGRYLESYAGDGAFVEGFRPGRPTRLLAVAEVAYGHGHRSVWDAETLLLAAAEAGFTAAAQRSYGDSDIDPAPDSPKREAESLYVEARKAG